MKEQKRHHGSRRVPDVSRRAQAELEEVARRRKAATRREIEELAKAQGWRIREEER